MMASRPAASADALSGLLAALTDPKSAAERLAEIKDQTDALEKATAEFRALRDEVERRENEAKMREDAAKAMLAQAEVAMAENAKRADEISASTAELLTLKATIDETRATQAAELAAGKAERKADLDAIATGKADLEALKAQLDAREAAIADAEARVAAAEAEIEAKKADLAARFERLKEALA